MTAQTPPLIPLRDFFDDPVRARAQVSPDGKRLAYLAPLDGRMNVWVRDVDGEGDDDRPATHDRVRSIASYRWTRDGERILHLQDTGGDENHHLFVTDATRPETTSRDLTPFDGVRTELLDLPKADHSTVLIAMNRREPTLMDVWRLDLETGELTLELQNPGALVDFVADDAGRVRVVRRQVEGGHHELLVRDDDGDLRLLRRYDRDDDGTPYALTPDGTGVWVRSAAGSDVARLVRVDLADGNEIVVDSHPDVDLEKPLVSDRTGELLGALYRTHDGLDLHPFDDDLAGDWRRLKELHAGDPLIGGIDLEPRLGSADADESVLVVSFNDDRGPGVTYLYRRDTGEAQYLYRPYPKLDPAHLAPMRPVTITSPDGLPLRCYLTLPLGVPTGGLPTVLWVHGGPWARDLWGYNPVVQALANRGLAVLQVNYRGSIGFGKAFVAAAEKQWAGEMHDDLLDAVAWTVDEGIADPDRVAIAGGSYGGYAALVGASFTPDVFACAYSIVGPSNLLTLLRSFPPYWRPMLANTFHRHIGDPDDPDQVEDLKARSPLFRADAIVRPLGITQTVNDPRVTKQESDQIVDALRERGVDVDYLVIEGEGHGFVNGENRLRAFEHMEAFLTRHLGGRRE